GARPSLGAKGRGRWLRTTEAGLPAAGRGISRDRADRPRPGPATAAPEVGRPLDSPHPERLVAWVPMPSTTETSLRRTPLYERHAAASAKLVPFAGWEMPVGYTGIREEHLAVRRRVGMFDVSHMGQVQTRGREAPGLL